MEELKPCPFCGGKAEIKSSADNDFWVECALEHRFCQVIPKTWSYETEQEAVEAWNKRA